MKADTAIYIAYEDFKGRDPAEPERNLMRAILRTAMEDLRKPGESYRDAKNYVVADDERYLYSFVNICNHLDLCPNTLRMILGIQREIEKNRNKLAA